MSEFAGRRAGHNLGKGNQKDDKENPTKGFGGAQEKAAVGPVRGGHTFVELRGNLTFTQTRSRNRSGNDRTTQPICSDLQQSRP
jgi:hypothetical protein